MAHDELSFLRGSLSGAALGSLLALAGCSRDWDAYDPRLGTTGSSVSSSSTGAGGSASSSSSLVSASSSSSGGAGAGGGGGGGAGGGTSAYAALVLGDGPVGYWRFGELSGKLATDELGAHDGTYVGTFEHDKPGAIPGDPDRATYFNGGDTSVPVGDAFDFTGNAPFTIEAWVNPDYLGASYRRIAAKEDPNAAAGRQGYMLFARGTADPTTGFERWVNGKVQGAVYSTTTLTLDAYNHVVVTYDGATLILYLNDQILDMQAASAPLADHAGLFVWGGGSDPLLDGGGHVSATLDEVAVYDKALPQARIDAHYKAVTGP